jgi:Xaa-Pro dipeptidase
MRGWSRRAALRGLGAAASFAIACERRGSTTPPTGDRSHAPPVEQGEFAELAGVCDGIAGPDAAEHAAHREAVRSKMRELDIAAVVLEPCASMTYVGGPGWHRSERPLLLVLPREGPPTILCPAFEKRTVLERVADHEIVVWREHEDPFARVGEVFAGLRTAKIAVDPTMRQFVAAGLARAWPNSAFVADDPIGDCRLRKTPAEIARLRRANEATQRAIDAVQRRVVVGTSQAQVAAWIEAAQIAAGLADPWVLALVGPNASFPHGTTEARDVRPGDAVLVDTGASLHGYRSDITRTFVVGEPSKALRRAWDTVALAQRAALAAIRPGATTGSVDAAARAVMAEAGYGADDRYFTHRLGHGIGLEVHEPPYLVGQGTLVLEPGMTMSDEPGIYVPGDFGVRHEDIVLVTAEGAEVFGELGPSRLT